MRKKLIVSFSGGKDSTAMLLMLLEKNITIDEIIFADTGVEFPEVYEHIKKVEKYIGRNITILKPPHNYIYYATQYKKVKGATIGANYGWSDFRSRWCTRMLKTLPMNKYFKEKYGGPSNYELAIGIAYDEKRREIQESNKIYPLINWGITEQMALDYCYSKGFDWNGYYEKFDHVSCFVCPLRKLKELYIIYKDYPDLWKTMQYIDKNQTRKFRPDYTLSELEEKFEREKDKFEKIIGGKNER